MRELQHGALRQLHAAAHGVAGAAVEVAFERHRAVGALVGEARPQRRERRQRQRFVVDGQPVAHRPPAPRQEGAHGVVVAERGGADAAVEVRRPLHVDADRAELLADPGVERGKRLRVVRCPERIGVLARRAEEELPRADAPPLAVQIDERLDHAGVLATAAGRLRAAEDLRVDGEPGPGTPVGAELSDRGAAKRVAVDAVRADAEAPEAAGDPGRRPSHVRFARGEKTVDGEGLLAARVHRRRQDQPAEHQSMGR